MSLLESLPAERSPSMRLRELEDAFRSWAVDPAKPEIVALGHGRDLAAVELVRRLRDSPARISASEAAQLGLPPGVTIATATADLLHATVDPDGPRCHSFVGASYYLRGLAYLEGEFQAIKGLFTAEADDARGDPDVG